MVYNPPPPHPFWALLPLQTLSNHKGVLIYSRFIFRVDLSEYNTNHFKYVLHARRESKLPNTIRDVIINTFNNLTLLCENVRSKRLTKQRCKLLDLSKYVLVLQILFSHVTNNNYLYMAVYCIRYFYLHVNRNKAIRSALLSKLISVQ